MKYIIISMYTVNTPYTEVIKDLEYSCKKFGLSYKSYPIPNQKDWVKNCAQKSAVIKKALDEFDCDVVWLDADAVIFKYPEFFDKLSERKDFDICAYINRKPFALKKYPQGMLISSTIYFKNNDNTKRLVDAWEHENEKKEYLEWDQRTLQTVVENGKYKKIEFPNTYIKEKPKGNRDVSVLERQGVVIGQKQISREYRDKMESFK